MEAIGGVRVFQLGSVYRAFTPSYVKQAGKTEDIYLVIGPSIDQMYAWSLFPVQYCYLNLLTGEQGVFHRDSYFGEAAEPL
jgi:hypothetical protein